MTIGGNNSVGASASVASSIEKAQPVAMIDVSIPYNAAARHSYNEWSSGKFDEATFQKFQAIYEEKVVAQVTAKKLARDYELEIARLQSIFAKTDADLAILASGEGEVELE